MATPGQDSHTPMLPRRAFLAATLSAITVGAAGALAWIGGLGAPQTESYRFSRGTNLAEGELARMRGHLARAVQDTRFDVVIVGHTGDQGDGAANLALSTERAEVAAAEARQLGLEDSRLTIIGAGGGSPMARGPDQSERAYQASLARVEITLRPQR